MKVSSIKTILPAAAAGLIALTSACTTAAGRAEKYMEETNRTQAELNAVLSGKPRIEQSKLDSVAYRDIFFGTEAAKDSANVAEFNKIAARMRVDDNLERWDQYSAVKNRLTEEGILIKDMNNFYSKINFCDGDMTKINKMQYYADDWAYRKFFEKIGIMDEELAEKCDEISEKIAP